MRGPERRHGWRIRDCTTNTASDARGVRRAAAHRGHRVQGRGRACHPACAWPRRRPAEGGDSQGTADDRALRGSAETGEPSRRRPRRGPGTVTGGASRSPGPAAVPPDRASGPATASSPPASPRASPSAARRGEPLAPGKQVVPAEPAEAIAFLRAAEQDASNALLERLGVAPASLAQLLASISASEATHAAILAAGGNTG